MNSASIKNILLEADSSEIKRIFKDAKAVKQTILGHDVYLRGLIELSNICTKDCFYCGIRKSNHSVNRYIMTKDEIIASAMFAYEKGFGSIVLQSGEREDENFIAFIENIVEEINYLTSQQLRITLSLGEQTTETYKRWFNSGAHRYLLRIETSNESLYNKIHPADHSYGDRVNCLSVLKEIGFQLGTGVMIGLPHQTITDLVNDILFFKEMDIDMIGMGPFIEHSQTPLFGQPVYIANSHSQLLELSLKMIAATRIFLPKINIAATTALQALDPFGREKGINAGANVIMPNVTLTQYRKDYLLYEDKPCVNDLADDCFDCVIKRIEMTGQKVALFSNGDSLNFLAKNNQLL
ncbi:MAG: [FeFe] hydrogenase H-cluster radical SAM maturase HydE [Melioribacteraceae bacterium]|nr:[FeFe] hydrogenase H-cluster radical SAM maturase HydE [Melioribacteraceae bacterium]